MCCAAVILAGCGGEPKAHVEGSAPTQKYVGEPERFEITVVNQDTKAFKNVGIEFKQAAWTIASVEPHGQPQRVACMRSDGSIRGRPCESPPSSSPTHRATRN